MRLTLSTAVLVLASVLLGSNSASSSFAFDHTPSTSGEPLWKQYQLSAEHRMQQAIVNNAINFASETIRELQSETPQEVCDNFNNQTAGVLTCNCQRFGKDETQVDCTYDAPQCSTDNVTCYTGSISQVLTVDLQARVVTTCTTFTTSELPAETCIRIFPVSNGRFRQIGSCSVSYSPNGMDAPNFCGSCAQCASNNATNATEISINCCNLQTDLKQTCGPVSQDSGAAVPRWDEIPASQAGKCVSGVVASTSWSPALVLAATTLVAACLL
jgi:hypothetical protein